MRLVHVHGGGGPSSRTERCCAPTTTQLEDPASLSGRLRPRPSFPPVPRHGCFSMVHTVARSPTRLPRNSVSRVGDGIPGVGLDKTERWPATAKVPPQFAIRPPSRKRGAQSRQIMVARGIGPLGLAPSIELPDLRCRHRLAGRFRVSACGMPQRLRCLGLIQLLLRDEPGFTSGSRRWRVFGRTLAGRAPSVLGSSPLDPEPGS